MKGQSENWFEDFLALVLLATVGYMLMLAAQKTEARRAAAAAVSRQIEVDEGSSVIETQQPASTTIYGGPGPEETGAPSPILEDFFWPGQNLVGPLASTLTGWTGNTAPGFVAITPPVNLNEDAGTAPMLLWEEGSGGVYNSLNL